MMQLLCLVAMEPPVDLSADAVRNEKVKVLQALPRWQPAGRLPQRGPRPVHRRLDPGERSPRLPRGERGRARLEDRHLRRDPAGAEQLAVGGRAVLPADRQAAPQAGDRDRHPVPPAADRAFRARSRRAERRQSARVANPAQRGGQPDLRGQGPRLAAAAPGGADGFPLRHGLRRPAARGLRATAPGRDARRPHALHPHRRGRERLAVHHHDPRRLAAARRAAARHVRRRQLGARGRRCPDRRRRGPLAAGC